MSGVMRISVRTARCALLLGVCLAAEGSIWYFPTGPQAIETHAKFLLVAPRLDRCATIGFRCGRLTIVPRVGLWNLDFHRNP